MRRNEISFDNQNVCLPERFEHLNYINAFSHNDTGY